MNAPIWQIKKDICDIGHRIWLKGFCAGNEGNHSVRISDDRVLCTPTGLSKGFLLPDDVCVVDMDGKQVEANPRGRKRTSEVLVHLAIYKKRPDVKAVIHSHPPHATAFAIAGIPLPEGLHPEAEVFLGKVLTAPYALPSTQALPDSLTPLITSETNTLLMGNHGSVSFSTSLTDSFYKLEILDAYCRILLLTKQLGRANVFSKEQMTDLLKVKAKFGLPDARLACAPEGCIGTDNDDFLATFDNPASAHCDCKTGEVEKSGASSSGGQDFEKLVQAITDQIMAAAR
ncbi:MAG: class II aldolase/adducin family protein [Planctomycetota bacterium]|nr:class II aldolase/adducin family protein [Planctomycetota bacterium]